MTEEQKKTMSPREVLEVLMPIESLDIQVHETRMIEIAGQLKPSEGIRGHGILILASNFNSIEVVGNVCNRWILNTVQHAEFDEIENTLYLTFSFPN